MSFSTISRDYIRDDTAGSERVRLSEQTHGDNVEHICIYCRPRTGPRRKINRMRRFKFAPKARIGCRIKSNLVINSEWKPINDNYRRIYFKPKNLKKKKVTLTSYTLYTLFAVTALKHFGRDKHPPPPPPPCVRKVLSSATLSKNAL